jgi:hypothetical protein
MLLPSFFRIIHVNSDLARLESGKRLVFPPSIPSDARGFESCIAFAYTTAYSRRRVRERPPGSLPPWTMHSPRVAAGGFLLISP